MVPAPPLVSPDGRFYLDDGRWVPLPRVTADSSAIARGVATGVGDFLARLLCAVLVIPALVFACVIGVQWVAPEPVEGVASVATLVVLLGAVYLLARSRD